MFRPLALILLLPLCVFAEARADPWRSEIHPAPAPAPAPARAPPAPAPAPAPAAHPRAAAAPPPRPLNEFERQAAETIKLTNDFRRRNGLPAFEVDPVCTAEAFDHAQDMARRGYFDHFGPDGSSPTSRYQRRNTNHQKVIRITENIARGNGTTPESALKMWLNSPGHRKHLVGTEMDHIGVGVANGSCFFAACTYFVQCFSNWP